MAIVSRMPKKLRNDDDFVDRLHHRYTSLLLVVFAVMVTMQQHVGKPITCWAPKEFTGSHTKYTNSFCWVNNTYFLPFEDEIPKDHEPHLRKEIIYYQWVPLILLVQAVLFYFPCQLWRAFNSKAGIDADNILDAAQTFYKAEKIDRRERTLRLITNQVQRFLARPTAKNSGGLYGCQSLLANTLCIVCGKRLGNYLTLLFLSVKVVYICNAFGQLFLLNSILRTDYNLFGIDMFSTAVHERSFLNATVFPKVTMCDLLVRRLGNIQRFTVQCLLPINLYTEIMYTFFWFWLVLLITVSFGNLMIWVSRALFSNDRLSYIRGHLEIAYITRDNDEDGPLVRDFVFNYLKQDGVFLLRLIGHNTNSMTAMDISCSLWEQWRLKKTDKPAHGKMNGSAKGPPPPPPPKPNHLKQRNNAMDNNHTPEEAAKLTGPEMV